jgi:hypothetical protein
MKVVPHTGPSAKPDAQSPPQKAKPGAKAFRDILDGLLSRKLDGSVEMDAGIVAPRSGQEMRDDTFGFGQLGVFGRYGAQARAQSSEHPLGATGDAAPMAGQTEAGQKGECSDTPQPADGVAAGQPRSSADAEAAFASAPGRVGPRGERCAGKIDLAVALDDTAAPSAQSALTGSVDEVPSAMEERDPVKMPDRRSDAPGVSLLASGTDDALSIVVGSRSGPDDYSGLRRLLEDTAAEFGVKVADFQLNGSRSQPSVSASGGNHGRRAR